MNILPKNIKPIGYLAGICLLILCLASCSFVSVSDSVKYRDNEGQFSEDFFRSIKPGQSSMKWVQAQFGEPLFIDTHPSGISVCTWQFVRQKQRNGGMLLIFRYRSLKEEKRYLHVASEDGTVLKSWEDRQELVDVQRLVKVINKEREKAKESQSQVQIPASNQNAAAKPQMEESPQKMESLPVETVATAMPAVSDNSSDEKIASSEEPSMKKRCWTCWIRFPW